MASFFERGGWWLLAQIPLMGLAYGMPPWLGALASGPQRWAAIALFVAGLALGTSARYALGPSFTPFPRPVERGAHISRGPYRFVRHPVYVAILVTGAAWALLWQSGTGAALTFAMLAFFDFKARSEERWLEAAYPSYAAYRRRVARFIPRLY
jgi:protein-S-isoprenylcysteine O-methyltransferase Ste14